MSIVIKKKNSLNHTIKVAVIVLAIFAAVGIGVKFTKNNQKESAVSEQSLSSILRANSSLLIQIIPLKIAPDSKEKEWTQALADTIKGKTEVAVQFGRADLLTENYAVEVDFLSKWKEGLGQALHYGDVTGLVPVLALISTEKPNENLLKQIDSLCTSKGVKAVLLIPEG